MRLAAAKAIIFVGIAGGLACAQMASRGVKPQARTKPSGLPWHAQLVDVAREAGLRSASIYGELDRVDYISETTSGGVALFDYDGDGKIDIYIINGTKFKNSPQEATNRLYRNIGGLKFEDVTEKAGLRRTGWGSGVCIGDIDNDGRTDMYVTEWGDNVMYRNNGDGTFSDVTATTRTALPQPDGKSLWSAGCTFIDFDRDGRLDLFVANYVDYDLRKTPKTGESAACNWKGIPVACGPRGLPTARHWLLKQEKDGTFRDVSEASGVASARGSYGLTATAVDMDGDGWTDIYVACDSTPSLFFRNLGTGKFAEEGIERGIALNDDGMEQAGMGLGLGDYNTDGKLDIFKTHFADDTHILYKGDGKGQYQDMTLAARLAVETRYVAWGAAIQDLDNDGLPDLFLVTGSVYPEMDRLLPAYPYKSPRMLFRNLDGAKFELLGEEAGPAVAAAHSSRGAAFADLDGDGDVDIVVWNRNEPPSLLRNDLNGREGRNWLGVKLEGTLSNRSAIGAMVTVEYGGRKQVQPVVSQSSFLSSNGWTLHFGLGAEKKARVEVKWPNGATQVVGEVEAGRVIEVKEAAKKAN